MKELIVMTKEKKHFQSDGNGGFYCSKNFLRIIGSLIMIFGVFAGMVMAFTTTQNDVKTLQHNQELICPTVTDNQQSIKAVEHDIENIADRTERIENKLDRIIENSLIQ